VVGIRHLLALTAPPSTCDPKARTRCAVTPSAASIGDHQQGRRDRGRRAFGQVQAYPRYGSEKKGLPTTYYLTVADSRSASTPSCRPSTSCAARLDAFEQGDPLRGLADEADVLVQTACWTRDDRAVLLPPRAPMIARRPTSGPRHRGSGGPLRLGRTSSCACRASPRRRLLRVTPFARQAGLGRGALLEAVRDRLGRASTARRAPASTPTAVIAAYDGPIDVTGTVLVWCADAAAAGDHPRSPPTGSRGG
jgi:pyruvate-ferredoxin/flavodoxin oxidoreductase